MRRVAVAVVVAVVVAAAVIVVTWCGGERASSPATKVTAAGGAGTAGARAAKPDPRTQARVAIAGRITVKGGRPLPGAFVCATAFVRDVSPEETRDPKCVTSDAAGRYGFDGLYAGTYAVAASAARHVPGQWRGPAPERRPSLDLAAGERRDDIDIALMPGGVEVRGTVSDINGGPIAEAWVSVGSDDWRTRGAAATTRSATDGTFAVWVGKGAVTAHAMADGYAPGSQDGVAPTQHLDVLLTPESVLAGTVVEAETGAPVAGAKVSVGRGSWGFDSWDGGEGSRGGDAISDEQGRFRITRLAPGRYKPTAESLGRYGTPADSVLLGLGQTVEGVVIPVHAVRVVTGRIVIDDGSAKPSGCKEGFVWARGKTDRNFTAATDRLASGDDGAVRFDAVPPGTYKLHANCQGFVAEDEYPDLVVGDTDVVGLEWKVRPGGTIVGTVKTRAGAPVAQVRVSSQTVGGDPRGQRSWETALTEDDGSFTLRGLSAGEYALTVDAIGHPEPKDPTKTQVAVGKETRVELVLEDGGAIAGVVVDERGKGVSGARVSAAGDRWDWRGEDERTGDDGSFEITGMAAGSYRVTASRSWSDPMRKPGSTDDDVQGERATVTVGGTAHVRLVVEGRNGTIAGVVVDAANAPVSDAYLAAERESEAAGAVQGAAVRSSRWSWDRKPVMTDGGGAFKLTGLAPGKYTVRAYRRGGGEAIAEHVAVGAANARLVLKPTASVSGTVTVKGGGTPEDMTIAISDRATGFTRRESYFKTGGAFAVADLPAGTFTVRASAAKGQGEVKVVLVEGEKKVGVTLELEPRVNVSGRLVALDDGAPVPGLQVMATPQRGEMMVFYGDSNKQSISGTDGRFVIEEAPAGAVTLQAWPVDFEESPFSFVSAPKVIASGRGEVNVGDLKVPRRRTGSRDRGGDLGFDVKRWDPTVDPDQVKLEVVRIRADGPAVKSGLVVGDVIVTIDGTDVKGENSYLAWSLMHVAVGTKVSFGLARGATVTITAVPEP